MKKWIIALFAFCVLVSFLSGCTSTPDAPPETPAPTPKPYVPPPVESPVIITPPELSGIPITLGAIPLITENALLMNFELDTRSKRALLPQDGYSLIIVFFAYNVDQVPPGFSPASAEEVRSADIPYKTRQLRVYLENVIIHKEQVPERGSPARIFNPDEPYVYGVVIETRQW